MGDERENTGGTSIPPGITSADPPAEAAGAEQAAREAAESGAPAAPPAPAAPAAAAALAGPPTPQVAQEPQAPGKKQVTSEPEPQNASRLTSRALTGAIGLAFTSIIGALLLCGVLVVQGITSSDVLLIRVLTSCVAVFIATGFAAFGFALFLIKADGALKAQIQTGTTPNTLETTAPGLAVFVCAVVVMYLALHMEITGNRTGENDDNKPTPTESVPTDAGVGTQAKDSPLGGPMEAIQ